MRYLKGTIDTTSDQDRRALEQILVCRFITHNQLWTLLRHRCYEMSRDSLGWRMRRLVHHGLVTAQLLPEIAPDRIYSLTESGVTCVQNGASVYSDHPASATKPAQIAHSIGLNWIHLKLLQSGILADWKWESEIRAHNEFSVGGFRKDYDALATLALGAGSLRLAVEYERWAKPPKAYFEILRRIDRDSNIEAVLYIVNNEHLHSLLIRCCHRRTERAIYVVLKSDFLRDPCTAALTHAGTLSVHLFSELCPSVVLPLTSQ